MNSWCHQCPTPAGLIQTHFRTLGQPFVTLGTMHFSLYYSPLWHHTVLRPSAPKTFIFVSSVHRIESTSLHLCLHGPWWSLGRPFCAWALGEASSVDDIHAASPLQCTAYCAMWNNHPSLAFYFFRWLQWTCMMIFFNPSHQETLLFEVLTSVVDLTSLWDGCSSILSSFFAPVLLQVVTSGIKSGLVSWSEHNYTPVGNSEETSWASLCIQHPVTKRGQKWSNEKG